MQLCVMQHKNAYTYETGHKLNVGVSLERKQSNQLVNLNFNPMEVITIESKAFLQLKEMLETLIQSIQSKNISTQNEWMTGNEVMGALKISSRTLQTYRDSGQLGFTQLGRKKIFYKRTDVDQLLNNKYLKPFKNE